MSTTGRLLRTLLFTLCLALPLLLGACSSNDDKDWTQASYDEILQAAQDTEVRFYMWGGSATINAWVDDYLTKAMKDNYGISLVRVPMDAQVFVNKLMAEKNAGKKSGTIDLLWINGENFKNAHQAGLLFGPYASKLPNYEKYVNKKLAANDFGYPTDGYETPYGWAQFVFEYDMKRTSAPPRSYAELHEWVKKNPGQFTYPQPPDFTGSAFLRQVFYAVTGGPEQYLGGFDERIYERNAPKLWDYLNEIKPYLWQEGRSYPKSSAAMETLFQRGEIAMNMSYNPLHAQNKVLEGAYAESVRTFAMKEGSIFNLHFTAIPFNAPNKPGAMVMANFLLSPEAQLSKFDPANWGDYPAIDLKQIPPESLAEFNAVELGQPTLPAQELAEMAVPEISAEYLERIERDWEDFVLHEK